MPWSWCAIYHQYTPVMLAYIYHTWILWVWWLGYPPFSESAQWPCKMSKSDFTSYLESFMFEQWDSAYRPWCFVYPSGSMVERCVELLSIQVHLQTLTAHNATYNVVKLSYMLLNLHTQQKYIYDCEKHMFVGCIWKLIPILAGAFQLSAFVYEPVGHSCKHRKLKSQPKYFNPLGKLIGHHIALYFIFPHSHDIPNVVGWISWDHIFFVQKNPMISILYSR